LIGLRLNKRKGTAVGAVPFLIFQGDSARKWAG